MRKTQSTADAVDTLIAAVGSHIKMATPLGVGKPNHFLNELYRRVKSNPDLQLTLYTALTLEVPQGRSDLEKRFLKPMTDRVFGPYPELDIERDRMKKRLPKNVEVIEFYFHAGKYKGHGPAQQNYLSSNYTHVVRDLVDRGINSTCQQVVMENVKGQDLISLSCNPDLTRDLDDLCKQKGQPLFSIGQINPDLPFMYGESIVTPDFFNVLIDNEDEYYPVFAPPKMSVSEADFMIGLHASALIKDDGEIQIGIGSLGDALVYALCLRQQDNETYRTLLQELEITPERYPILAKEGGSGSFDVGLFAGTEMLVDSFAELYKANILKKRVYDSVVLQRLLNQGEITETVEKDILQVLVQAKAIRVQLTEEDFHFLQEFGILQESCRWHNSQIILPSGEKVDTDLSHPTVMQQLTSEALGDHLRNGAVAHGGFFLGPRSFYDFLKNLPVEERKLFRMKRISQINQLYGNEEIDRLQRTHGRFVNTCMKVCLNGAAASDALEDGTQISGVGGQYNFVAMAHELKDGRSLLQLRSTRSNSRGELESNIVFNYGNITIPRHLRDVVITEYGIAHLRGKTDAEVAQELIQIADSRFQDQLIAEAQQAGKLPQDFHLNTQFRNNRPELYGQRLSPFRKQGLFPAFPFGTDLTEDEITLGRALKKLKALLPHPFSLLKLLLKSIKLGAPSESEARLLQRMALEKPQNLKEKLYQRLLRQALRS